MTALATAAAVAAVHRFEYEIPSPIWLISTAGIIALSTALWQGGRVFTSLQRDGNGAIDPKPVSFFSIESNALWTLLFPFAVAAALVGYRMMD